MRKRNSSFDARTVLLDALDQAFDQRSWHGTNLIGSLRGVDLKIATTKVYGRKSIWEQLLHAAYWKHRVLCAIAGKERFPRKGSNWPKVPTLSTSTAWAADVALLRA